MALAEAGVRGKVMFTADAVRFSLRTRLVFLTLYVALSALSYFWLPSPSASPLWYPLHAFLGAVAGFSALLALFGKVHLASGREVLGSVAFFLGLVGFFWLLAVYFSQALADSKLRSWGELLQDPFLTGALISVLLFSGRREQGKGAPWDWLRR